MTPRELERMQQETRGRTQLTLLLCYLAFRVYGATKKHAWDRARIAVAEACIDKAVEWTGVIHPSSPPKPGEMQITFEGGPAHREVRAVELCGHIDLTSGDRVYRYNRTDRKRGKSIVFQLEVEQ